MDKNTVERMRRFFRKVERAGPDECWNWTGAKSGKNGSYGQFSLNGARMGAHCASWILHNGPIPEGLEVCHKCDNGLCVNPAHLWLGTHRENMWDKFKKQRHNHPIGSRVGVSKLVDSDIPQIRQLRSIGIPYRHIAAQFGVSTTSIIKVVQGKSWKHIA